MYSTEDETAGKVTNPSARPLRERPQTPTIGRMLSTPDRASNRDPCFSRETAFSMSKGQAGDLVHPRAGVDGAYIARPAKILIDSNGKILWVSLTEDYRVHAGPQRVKGVRWLGVAFPGAKRVVGAM